MSIGHEGDLIGRRDALCAGGAAVVGAMLSALLGGSKPVRAAGITGPVPEVDRLAVRVVIDSYQFAVAPSKSLGDVDVQHFGWGISGDKPPGRTLISEFGLSMHAVSQRGAETRNILMDFGFTSQPLVNNVDLLGLDPAALDALVLSHGHYNHFGGIVGFLRGVQRQAESQPPALRRRRGVLLLARVDGAAGAGQLRCSSTRALEEADVAVASAEGPALVADHAFTTR
jgi:7,8-dihydropterin-6-yl-methyl-4-(beta-D-ribofuranosyl)aminobenzene 5'-phosphate synthase